MAKHTPIRTCIGCGGKFPQHELARFVLIENQRLSFDKNKKQPGRGAYICKKQPCIDQAIRKKSLHKTWRKNIAPKLYIQLKEIL